VEIIGAVLITTGHLAGLYLAAISMIILLAFMISGAWLLIVGTLGPSAPPIRPHVSSPEPVRRQSAE